MSLSTAFGTVATEARDSSPRSALGARLTLLVCACAAFVGSLFQTQKEIDRATVKNAIPLKKLQVTHRSSPRPQRCSALQRVAARCSAESGVLRRVLRCTEVEGLGLGRRVGHQSHQRHQSHQSHQRHQRPKRGKHSSLFHPIFGFPFSEGKRGPSWSARVHSEVVCGAALALRRPLASSTLPLPFSHACPGLPAGLLQALPWRQCSCAAADLPKGPLYILTNARVTRSV